RHARPAVADDVDLVQIVALFRRTDDLPQVGGESDFLDLLDELADQACFDHDQVVVAAGKTQTQGAARLPQAHRPSEDAVARQSQVDQIVDLEIPTRD